MDNPTCKKILQICLKHNQPILLQDPKANQGSFCFFCLQNMTGLVPPDEVQKQQQEFVNQSKKEINKDKQQFLNALDGIQNYKKNFNQILDKIIQGMIDQIEIIDQFIKKNQEQIESDNNVFIDKLKSEYQIQIQSNVKAQNQAKLLLQNLQSILSNIDKLITLLDESKQKSKKFKYELIQESSKKESSFCRCFAFSRDRKLLIVGCGKEIIIYQYFNNQIAKEISRLNQHTNFVSCLLFMKLTNSFFSASFDGNIIMWELNKSGTQTAKSQLKEHQNIVVCFLTNKKEDMLISGSFDETVKFWMNVNNQWHCQQTIGMKDKCLSLSLNEKENKLISCGEKFYIQVIQLQSEKSWSIVQTIQVVEFGYRLSFLFGDQ